MKLVRTIMYVLNDIRRNSVIWLAIIIELLAIYLLVVLILAVGG